MLPGIKGGGAECVRLLVGSKPGDMAGPTYNNEMKSNMGRLFFFFFW